MTENFDEIESKIIGVLDSFLLEAKQNNYKGDKIWTNRIIENIGDL